MAQVVLYGTSLVQILFGNLHSAFSLAHPNSLLTYQPVSTVEAQAHLNLGDPVVVDSLDLDFPDTSLQFPLFYFPLALVHHAEIGPLRLSQQALVDVFLGRITRWNDPNLTDLNPGSNLPDERITLVIPAHEGSTTQFFSALSELGQDTFNSSFVESPSENVKVVQDVCATVAITRYSLGISNMEHAITTNTKLVLLENKLGFFASPENGVPSALNEYHAAQKAAGNVTISMHNMPGRLSWPLIGRIVLVLPSEFAKCNTLHLLQDFVSLLLFHSETDRLVRMLGWEPARSLTILDNSLGPVLEDDAIDYHEELHNIVCEQKANEELFHVIGSSAPLWPFVLKILVAYAPIDPFLVLSSSSSNITTLLTAMVIGEESGMDIDLSLTWKPLMPSYPALLSVPAFMGSLTPLVNLGLNTSITLSLPVVADIFSRNITRWDDARIQSLNPAVVLPNQSIIVFASPITQPDGTTALLAPLLVESRETFSWSQVNTSVPSEDDIPHFVQDVMYSIGYSFGHQITNLNLIPNLAKTQGRPLQLSEASLAACWEAMDHPNCWPLSLPLVFVLRQPIGEISCEHQQLGAKFVDWVIRGGVVLQPLMIPNVNQPTMGEAEYCQGRSMLKTNPEPQELSNVAIIMAQLLCIIGLLWAASQILALAIARNHSQLKSASVIFSLCAVAGVLCMLISPLLIVQNSLTTGKCGASLWLIMWGFSLTYGALFAKLYRLYRIFSSRSLIIPRLNNRKLLLFVAVFLAVDLVLLLVYGVSVQPQPEVFSAMIPSSIDIVTGHQLLTWTMCAYHPENRALQLLLAFKLAVAVSGALMAFFIRQVDRRFTSSTALGLSFYNMFLTVIIAVVLLVFFPSERDPTLGLMIPTFCGLWILLVTLGALTFDSNVLLACGNFLKPLVRLARSSSPGPSPGNSKDSMEENRLYKDKGSFSKGGFFFVNRNMFPSKYGDFDSESLEKILEELNFQRAAVRRAIAEHGGGGIPLSPITEKRTVDKIDPIEHHSIGCPIDHSIGQSIDRSVGQPLEQSSIGQPNEAAESNV